MTTRFYHVGIVARDPLRLARFYVDVFDCIDEGVRHDVAGDALGRGMGLVRPRIRGLDLRLPGHGDDGPVLEIFALDDMVDRVAAVAEIGLMHIAFGVDDVADTLERVIDQGGAPLGGITELSVEGVGVATMVYARDPEGNIIEIQRWDRSTDA